MQFIEGYESLTKEGNAFEDQRVAVLGQVIDTCCGLSLMSLSRAICFLFKSRAIYVEALVFTGYQSP